MNTLVLNEIHEAAGAHMVEFAGWRMPIDYGSAIREVKAVRAAAGIFDVSHMGRLEIVGESAVQELNALLTNDVTRISDGGAQYTLMCRDQGGVIDDLIIYRMSASRFLAVVNASNLAKDKAWLSQGLSHSAAMVDNTPNTSLFALQGPAAERIMIDAGFADAAGVKRFHFATGQITQREVTAARTGYTGEDGFEIICANDAAILVWNALISAGAPHGLAPCGLAARDVLRIEAGLPLYGHEIDENTFPAEAGLARWVRLDKDHFVGRAAIAEALEEGMRRKLAGVQMLERGVPRSGDEVVSPVGNGNITSGTFSPTLGCGIAMAYLPPTASERMEVEVSIHGGPRRGVVVRLPFYSGQPTN